MSFQEQPPQWGRNNKPPTPEELIAKLIKKIQDFFSDKPGNNTGQGTSDTPPPPSPFALFRKLFTFLLIIIVFQGILGSFYKISPSEVGVILRLGKYHKTTASGLHFKIPFVDSLSKVDVKQIRKEEFGFRVNIPGQRSTFSRRNYNMESLMLTADKNVINIAWVVQYQINDPFNYLFKVKDVRQAVRDASESVTRRIVGNMDFDYVLGNRDLFANNVRYELQSELDHLEAGINLVTVQFKDINPPDQVKPAFNEVNEADQDMKRLVNEAEEIYNKTIPKAKGDAKKILEEAHGYATARVNEAKGDTQRFIDLLHEYKSAPEVTRQRIYLETMQEIIPSMDSVYIMDEDNQTALPLLNLTNKTH